MQDLQEALENLARQERVRHPHDGSGEVGEIFVLRSDLLPLEAVEMLSSVARIVFMHPSERWRASFTRRLLQRRFHQSEQFKPFRHCRVTMLFLSRQII